LDVVGGAVLTVSVTPQPGHGVPMAWATSLPRARL